MKSAPLNTNSLLSILNFLFSKGYLEGINDQIYDYFFTEYNLYKNDYKAITSKTYEILQNEDEALKLTTRILNITVDSIDSSSNDYTHLKFDPYIIADNLLFINKQEVHKIFKDDGSIFLENYKFEKEIFDEGKIFLVILLNITFPQINHEVSYNELIRHLINILTEDDPITIKEVQKELLTYEVLIEEDFLINILRNNVNFLLIYDEEIKVDLNEEIFRNFELVSDMYDSNEYIKAPYLSYKSKKKYYQIEYEINTDEIKRFLKFHNDLRFYDLIDELELTIKLRHWNRRKSYTIQNIPKSIHEFIVDWIKKNNKVWQTRDAKKILGKEFFFKPENIPPGRLLVYGNTKRFFSKNHTSLVLAEKVSEKVQEKGMIHPSRVSTDFVYHNYVPSTEEIENIKNNDELLKNYGLVDLDEYSKILLKKQLISQNPYNIKKCSAEIEATLNDKYKFIGLNIMSDNRHDDIINKSMQLRLKRAAIAGKFKTKTMTKQEFFIDMDERQKILFNKLF